MNRKVFFLFFQSLCVFVLSLSTSFSYSQTPKKLKDFSAGKIETVAADRLGNLFLILRSGKINKYDANGRVLASLTKGKTRPFIDACFHPIIYSYSRDEQKNV